MHGSMQNVAPVINQAHPGGMLRLAFFAAKQDPAAYCEGLLGHNPRALCCSVACRGKSRVGITTSRGAWPRDFGTIRIRKLHVADRRGRSGGRWLCQVKRIVCAIDCGMYVNPDTIEAQIQGGALFGLTAALHGSITFKDGRVEQSNFDSYLPMRIDEVPLVETHLIKNAEAPGGIGEAPTAIVSAAVNNAIFAATGKRLRSLPFDKNSLKSSF